MRLSRNALEKYRFEEKFFSTDEGYVTFPSTYHVRLFVESLNKKRDLLHFPEIAARASEINGISLLNEISHYLFEKYQKEIVPNLYKEISEFLNEAIGKNEVDKAINTVVMTFPPPIIYFQKSSPESYLESTTKDIPNREIIIEELIHIWLENNNPALNKHRELFEDEELKKISDYGKIISEIEKFFLKNKPFGPKNENFFKMLRDPLKEYPHSIKAQLEYIAKEWASILGPLYYKILSALDLFAEEEKLRGLGSGLAQVYEYDGLEENYTPDADWMPNVVMIAKNAYVWLYQLSKKHGREFRSLDQIPEEELAQLSRWGINALWLIGLWERSPASKLVKQWCGNPEAEASAYSLYDYIIAYDLGGENSFLQLKQKALKYNIRLASDMVPNHTGIDSKWVREHPDWYISLEYPPFPSYQYTGASLSQDPNIGIFLEDRYFNRTDAAVTFKRVGYRTGDTRYIYHGNDGTSMPWNDTAQLNYLLPEVREAVIKTILHVAHKFSIIRFDAAMTLTRKHFQRLWFPPPGSGGDIPSRAGLGISHEEFMQRMPQEFWREVVDRVKKEKPETLLLAEAFWLLEGFFVRTLGMHRVYNSAFMNMLRDEDNAKYRSVIKNTLEYDPEILKRFVNFMNNPDEDTAVNQFGKGDKYFGICLLLATFPGLPMIGHGQIEGWAEKYGMEYRRSYWNEEIDWGFYQYHEKVIFPLLKRRYLYSGVKNFFLYDFFTKAGYVDENVFCFSNGTDKERSLIIYNNNHQGTSGWIKNSAAFYDRNKEKLVQRSLGYGLKLSSNSNHYLIFRDQFTGLEYIRNSEKLFNDGLEIILGSYKAQALIDLREIPDNEWNHLHILHDYLGGRGVPNIEEAKQFLIYEPLLSVFRKLLDKKVLNLLSEAKTVSNFNKIIKKRKDELIIFIKEVNNYSGEQKEINLLVDELKEKQTSLAKLLLFSRKENPIEILRTLTVDDLGIILAWLYTHLLGKIKTKDPEYIIYSHTWVDEWLLGRTMNEIIINLPKAPKRLVIQNPSSLVKVLISHQNWEKNSQSTSLIEILRDPEVQSIIQLNRYQENLWFNQENFEFLIKFLVIIALINRISIYKIENMDNPRIKEIIAVFNTWQLALQKSEFKLDQLLDFLDLPEATTLKSLEEKS